MSQFSILSPAFVTIRQTKSMLDRAVLGWQDMNGADEVRRQTGLYDAIVYGRSVTFVLQNLRTHVGREQFDEWYQPHVDVMRSDPLLHRFAELRTEILKQGPPSTYLATPVTDYDAWMDHLLSNPPANATGQAIIDGEFFWFFTEPDGTTRKESAPMPSPQETERFNITWSMAGAPTEHLGNQIRDRSLIELVRIYLRYLHGLIDAAEREFLSDANRNGADN